MGFTHSGRSSSRRSTSRHRYDSKISKELTSATGGSCREAGAEEVSDFANAEDHAWKLLLSMVDAHAGGLGGRGELTKLAVRAQQLLASSSLHVGQKSGPPIAPLRGTPTETQPTHIGPVSASQRRNRSCSDTPKDAPREDNSNVARKTENRESSKGRRNRLCSDAPKDAPREDNSNVARKTENRESSKGWCPLRKTSSTKSTASHSSCSGQPVPVTPISQSTQKKVKKRRCKDHSAESRIPESEVAKLSKDKASVEHPSAPDQDGSDWESEEEEEQEDTCAVQ